MMFAPEILYRGHINKSQVGQLDPECGNCCTYIYYPPNLAITAASHTNFIGDVSNSLYDQDPDQDQDPVIPTNAFSPG